MFPNVLHCQAKLIQSTKIHVRRGLGLLVVGEWLVCGARYLLASASAGAGAQLGAPSGLPASSCPGGAIHIGEQAGDHHHGDGAIHNQHHIGTWSNIITQVLLWIVC